MKKARPFSSLVILNSDEVYCWPYFCWWHYCYCQRPCCCWRFYWRRHPWCGWLRYCRRLSSFAGFLLLLVFLLLLKSMLLMAFPRQLAFLLLLFLAIVGAIAFAGVSLSADVHVDCHHGSLSYTHMPWQTATTRLTIFSVIRLPKYQITDRRTGKTTGLSHFGLSDIKNATDSPALFLPDNRDAWSCTTGQKYRDFFTRFTRDFYFSVKSEWKTFQRPYFLLEFGLWAIIYGWQLFFILTWQRPYPNRKYGPWKGTFSAENSALRPEKPTFF